MRSILKSGLQAKPAADLIEVTLLMLIDVVTEVIRLDHRLLGIQRSLDRLILDLALAPEDPCLKPHHYQRYNHGEHADNNARANFTGENVEFAEL
jgi:hypothetical protein